MIHDDVKHQATGNWPFILGHLGIDEAALCRKGGPCPICREGTDRYRFLDKNGSGNWFCRGCGCGGDGWDLLMRVEKIDFNEAARRVREALCIPEQERRVPEHVGGGAVRHRSDPIQARKRLIQTWKHSFPCRQNDVVYRYMASRSIHIPLPAVLRRARLRYYYEDGNLDAFKTYDGMIALFSSATGQPINLHRTFLEGAAKAPVECPRKQMEAIQSMTGGAVRLFEPTGSILGVAEGIETALAAHILFDVPVWSTLNRTLLESVVVPDHIRQVVIFADSDANGDGQVSAGKALERFVMEGKKVKLYSPHVTGQDWNDVLMERLPALKAA